MRILLTIISMSLTFSSGIMAQTNFIRSDRQTYELYLKNDYRNLKRTADKMISQGIDFYYLRMRLGILSYNRQLYADASGNFTKAIEYSSLDTISREYIYFSYLFSGRKADADLFLESIPWNLKNSTLKSKVSSASQEYYVGSSLSTSPVILFRNNKLYYEAVKSSLSISAGFESYFLKRFKGTLYYTNFRKSGTVYSSSIPKGTALNFNQNQVYAKLTGYIFPGWEFYGFSHLAFFVDTLTAGQKNAEYLAGIGISKNGWKIRTGANLSYSNFSNSHQIRGEGYLTFLPFGNLNLYLTSGGIYQYDYNWGETYQINQDIGFRICRSLWMEAGVIKGNSFLYAGNQGFIMNNSFHIPAITIYGNIIYFINKKFSVTLTPYYAENQIYSWDLKDYTRTNKLNIKSFGGSIKLAYKNNQL